MRRFSVSISARVRPELRDGEVVLQRVSLSAWYLKVLQETIFAEIIAYNLRSAMNTLFTTYIHQLPKWPNFEWDPNPLFAPLEQAHSHQQRLLKRMQHLGFTFRREAELETLTEDIIKSSEIEGEKLNTAQVRSSVARRLGMEVGGLQLADRNVEGVVEMMLDATTKFSEPLTQGRLFAWHTALFPQGRSGMRPISVGAWRTDSSGPMQVISGPIGKEHVHFEAPRAERLPQEMAFFLDWFEGGSEGDWLVKAGLAHLWFVTLHPFEDGNGRIARAIADMALARSERRPERFYSMSAQIRRERSRYYEILERTQKGGLDVTPWMEWFLGCLARAIQGAEVTVAPVERRGRFWDSIATLSLNDRQRNVLSRLLDDFEGKLTSSKWAKLAKCSQDTATRDIADLVQRDVLKRNPGSGRATNYSLIEPNPSGPGDRL
jgi:Fic family protein